MEKIFKILGGRKMFFAILLTIIATIFLFVNKSDFAGWSNFMIWIFGSYAIGNGIEHISEMKKNKQ
jgi:hypothetical protein|tara:strand:- start:133 stop:330 length:198 start_codon:yes stop_codon:yes gene_type:complete